MRRAFKKWSLATNLDFVETRTGNVDIWVRFAKGYHSDSFAFDGPGGTLAHAFYPDTDGMFYFLKRTTDIYVFVFL